MSNNLNDIKVKVNYPQDEYWINEIETSIARWILNQQIQNIGEEDLKVVYPIWIRAKEIEINKGTSFKEAKKSAIKEFIDNKI